MSHSKYLQDSFEKRLDHLVEECGEFISAYAKMRRWGAFSYNPELPEDEREPNIAWVEREFEDIERAIGRLNQLDWTKEKLEEVFPLHHE